MESNTVLHRLSATNNSRITSVNAFELLALKAGKTCDILDTGIIACSMYVASFSGHGFTFMRMDSPRESSCEIFGLELIYF